MKLAWHRLCVATDSWCLATRLLATALARVLWLALQEFSILALAIYTVPLLAFALVCGLIVSYVWPVYIACAVVSGTGLFDALITDDVRLWFAAAVRTLYAVAAVPMSAMCCLADAMNAVGE